MMAVGGLEQGQGLRALKERGHFELTASPVLLLLLNLADALFTSVYLHLGVAEEANPLMRMAWEASPLTFMVVKLSVVSAGLFVLCLSRGTKMAEWALKASVGVYAVLLAWHLAFLAHVVTS